MTLEIRHLRLVEAIAREGSVTRAGGLLHLSQSALSHQLRELEDRLGVALFHRLPKRMLPTSACKRILSAAARILEQLRRIEDDVQRSSDDRDGILRIASESHLAQDWLTTRLAAFMRRFPRVDVRLSVEMAGQPIQGLLEGRLDIAFVCLPAWSSRLVFEPLFKEELVVVTKRGNALSQRHYFSAQDLAGSTLILPSPVTENLLLNQVLEPAGVEPRRVWQVQTLETLVDLVRAGLGIAVMARGVARSQLKNGDLMAFQLTAGRVFQEWAAARPRLGSLEPQVEEFIRLFQGPESSGTIAAVETLSARVPAATQA